MIVTIGARVTQVGRVVLGEDDALAGALLLAARRHDLLLRGGLRGGALGDAPLDRLDPQLAGHERGGVEVDRLVDGGEDPVADQLLDDVGVADAERVGQVRDGDGRRQLDRVAATRDDRLGLDGDPALGAVTASLRTRARAAAGIYAEACVTSASDLVRARSARRGRAGPLGQALRVAAAPAWSQM